MKRFASLFVIVAMFLLMLPNCSTERNVCINNLESEKRECYTFQPYGMFNEDIMKNDQVEYRLVAGNNLWSIILCETLVVPIVIFGYFLFVPVGEKTPASQNVKGAK